MAKNIDKKERKKSQAGVVVENFESNKRIRVFKFIKKYWTELAVIIVLATGCLTFYSKVYKNPRANRRTKIEEKLMYLTSNLEYEYESNLTLKYFSKISDTVIWNLYFTNKLRIPIKNFTMRIVTNRRLFQPLEQDNFEYPLIIKPDDNIWSDELLFCLLDNKLTIKFDLFDEINRYVFFTTQDSTFLTKGPYAQIENILNSNALFLSKPDNDLPQEIKAHADKIALWYPAFCKMTAGVKYRIIVEYQYDNYMVSEILYGIYSYLLCKNEDGGFITTPLVLDDLIAFPYVFYKEKGKPNYDYFFSKRDIHKTKHEEFKSKFNIGQFEKEQKKDGDYMIPMPEVWFRQEEIDRKFLNYKKMY